MKNLYKVETDGRVRRRAHPMYGSGDEVGGSFFVFFPTREGRTVLTVIASSGCGWDHVSVSLPTRCPTWPEMAFVAEKFFEPHEVLVQYRPPPSDYVNDHPYCLHWWRWHDGEIPRPPKWMVGGMTAEEAAAQEAAGVRLG